MTDHQTASETSERFELLEMTTTIVASQQIHAADLPGTVRAVFDVLSSLAGYEAVEAAPADDLVQLPAVPVGKSITPDYLISLEDGTHHKLLKRHLSAIGLTPDQYINKWGLPHDYPMVAPNYSAHRRELAVSRGLGKKRFAA